MSSVEATRPNAIASISRAASIGASLARFRSAFARRIAIGACLASRPAKSRTSDENASEAVPVDRRERGLGEIRKSIQDLLAAAGALPHLERLGNVAEGREVGSRTEGAVPRARDDETPDGLVLLQFSEGLLELVEDLRAHRVQSIGSVERDRRGMGLGIFRHQESFKIHPIASFLVFVESPPGLRAEVSARRHLLEDFCRLGALTSLQIGQDDINA